MQKHSLTLVIIKDFFKKVKTEKNINLMNFSKRRKKNRPQKESDFSLREKQSYSGRYSM